MIDAENERWSYVQMWMKQRKEEYATVLEGDSLQIVYDGNVDVLHTF